MELFSLYRCRNWDPEQPAPFSETAKKVGWGPVGSARIQAFGCQRTICRNLERTRTKRSESMFTAACVPASGPAPEGSISHPSAQCPRSMKGWFVQVHCQDQPGVSLHPSPHHVPLGFPVLQLRPPPCTQPFLLSPPVPAVCKTAGTPPGWADPMSTRLLENCPWLPPS